MYVVKLDKRVLVWKVSVLKKSWSDTMSSNEVSEIASDKIMFRYRADRWSYKKISEDLLKHKKLEIING